MVIIVDSISFQLPITQLPISVLQLQEKWQRRPGLAEDELQHKCGQGQPLQQHDYPGGEREREERFGEGEGAEAEGCRGEGKEVAPEPGRKRKRRRGRGDLRPILAHSFADFERKESPHCECRQQAGDAGVHSAVEEELTNCGPAESAQFEASRSRPEVLERHLQLFPE